MEVKRKNFDDKDELEKLYKEFRTMVGIARYYGVNEKTVARAMKKFGIKSIIGSQGARKRIFDFDYFENIDTQEKAYWLGFIMADGCVYKGSDKYSLRLQINLKAGDIEHLRKFQKAIGSDYKIQEKLVRGYPTALLKINSTKMCKDLMQLGVVRRKSSICKYPPIKEEFDKNFILGYFDGDGCIKKYREKGKWNFNIVGGMDMLEKIQKKLPVNTQIYYIKNKKVVSLETGAHEKIKNLYEYLYTNSEIHLERKKQKFEYFYCKYIMSPSGVIH